MSDKTPLFKIEVFDRQEMDVYEVNFYNQGMFEFSTLATSWEEVIESILEFAQ